MERTGIAVGGVSFWTHAIAAILFGVLALSEARKWPDARGWALVGASVVTALWAAVVTAQGSASALAGYAETIRNAGWLVFLFVLLRRGDSQRHVWALGAVYGALVLVLIAQSLTGFASPIEAAQPHAMDETLKLNFILRMTFAVGALTLVHNLHAASTPVARGGMGLPMAALAAMWAYDFNLYTFSYIARDWAVELSGARGLMMSGVAVVLALAVRRDGTWMIRLSRAAAFQSLSLVAAATYLMVVLGVTALMNASDDGANLVQVGFLLAAAVAAIVLLPSPRLRAWLRVMLAKHLFAHRYDYRAEWLRFNDTLGHPGDVPAPLEMRMVKALADLTESPAGLLLLPHERRLVVKADWNWDSKDKNERGISSDLADLLAQGRIVEIDPLRAHAALREAAIIPSWMRIDTTAWAIVPLIHYERLAGAVLLARPALDRVLDWEDFDLLRVAGRQVASYLAEAQGQEDLSDARRFDEFNRRFAFIMHDIKNLVSQLTLVTRNAERHADNPAFRADMILTLQSSTARMNDLLARLSQHNKARPDEPSDVALGTVITALAAHKRVQHPVVIAGLLDARAIADPVRLEAALAHLVQNAIDASPPNEPVTLRIIEENGETGIEVIDQGCGMTEDFMAGQLFRAFASTKDGGFGIGAYESRSLVVAMGGRIDVKSEVGSGTCFTVWLAAVPRETEAIAWREEMTA